MGRYVIRRVIQAVPLLVALSVITFVLLQLLPGGPTTVYRGVTNVTTQDIARLERDLGLDQPLWVQYGTWLIKFVQGDWGVSIAARRPVLDIVLERLPATLTLMAAALTVSVVLSLPLGIIAALRRDTWVDQTLTVLSFVGLSIPIFWLGLMMIVMFTVVLGILPGGGIGPPGREADLPTRLRYLILPTLTLSFVSVGYFTRYLRASMIEVLRTDYIRFGRARGLPSRSLYLRHGLRNAAIPYVTVLALHIPDYLIGLIVVETIFSWPGTGRLFWESAVRFDYPVLMGILILGSLLVILSNLLADVLYGMLDPRVRYD